MKRIISVLLVLTLLLAVICVPVSAKGSGDISITVPQDLPLLDRPTDIPLLPKVRTNSVYEFTGSIFSYNGTLTSSNTNDLYCFSLTQPRSVAIDISSTNAQYAVMLCIVDWSTGTVTPTDYGNLAGSSNAIILNVPAGDYALLVFSIDGSLGSSYTVMYNSTNPPYASDHLNDTRPDLSVVTLYYEGALYYYDKLYSNGKNVNSLLSNISYHREDTWPIETGRYWVNHNIDYGTIKYLYYCPSVTTAKGNSNNALLIDLGVGTLWTYWQQIVNNNGTGGSDFTDFLGLQTPRYFDSVDAQYAQYLVYDIDTNQYIYFDSIYSDFYEAEHGRFTREVKEILK